MFVIAVKIEVPPDPPLTAYFAGYADTAQPKLVEKRDDAWLYEEEDSAMNVILSDSRLRDAYVQEVQL